MFEPRGAARMRPVHDAVRNAAHGKRLSIRERHAPRKLRQLRRDPCGVLFGETVCLADAAARRHGEHHVALRITHAQRIAPRAGVPHDRDVELLLAERKRYAFVGLRRLFEKIENPHQSNRFVPLP